MNQKQIIMNYHFSVLFLIKAGEINNVICATCNMSFFFSVNKGGGEGVIRKVDLNHLFLSLVSATDSQRLV